MIGGHCFWKKPTHWLFAWKMARDDFAAIQHTQVLIFIDFFACVDVSMHACFALKIRWWDNLL